jgi:hypothetical protein
MHFGVFTVLSIWTLFAACTKKQHDQPVLADTPDSLYIQQGDQLIAQTFDTLSKALIAAVNAGGFAHAVTFCNEKAYPITNTYATEGITIRRSSLKYRNPSNRPDSLEAAVLNDFLFSEAKPRLIRKEGIVHYIKPILLQPMCLNCHGKKGEHILPEVQTAIDASYPDDQATGYAPRELRGIWHIAFAIK